MVGACAAPEGTAGRESAACIPEMGRGLTRFTGPRGNDKRTKGTEGRRIGGGRISDLRFQDFKATSPKAEVPLILQKATKGTKKGEEERKEQQAGGGISDLVEGGDRFRFRRYLIELASPRWMHYEPGMQIEIEHCYSGFLGYPYVAFIWCGNVLVGCICRSADGKYVVSKGVKAP